MAVTAQATWVAKTHERILRYDSYGKYISSDVSKEALATYDKVLACLEYLQIRFNEAQKSMPEIKATLDKVSPNLFEFNADFPAIEKKYLSNGTINVRVYTVYYCAQE